MGTGANRDFSEDGPCCASNPEVDPGKVMIPCSFEQGFLVFGEGQVMRFAITTEGEGLLGRIAGDAL